MQSQMVESLPDRTDKEVVVFYVVYENPRDYPGMYVVRKQAVGPGTHLIEREPHVVSSDLDGARAAIPRDLIRMSRLPGDEAQILESWL